LLVISLPTSARASSILLPGYDLLMTTTETDFFDVPWRGVPIGDGKYNFGSGLVGIGLTDTIVHRTETATGPSDTIDADLIALQLRTVNKVDLGAGLRYYYITLQSVRGGLVGDGEMTITFAPGGEVDPHGTFTSSFDVYFDVRVDSLFGPIVMSDHKTIIGGATPWSHFPPEVDPGDLNPVEIPGVNVFLNGVDRSNDFWPVGKIEECADPPGCHVVITAVPEPSLVVLLALGSLATLRRRRS